MSRGSIGEAPFQVPHGSDHLYMDPVRRGALSILITSIGDGVPAVLVSGGPEIGKTSLMIALAEALAERRGIRLLRFEQVFQCSEETSLHDIVSSCQRPEQTVNVLLLDDADRLADDVRDGLWSWAEQFRASVAPLTIVLSATPKPVLHDSASRATELSQVADRVIVLEPLSTVHLQALIRHRLDAAGYGGPDPFTPAAIERIAFYSRGYPGRITRLCRHILSKSHQPDSLPLPASAVKDAAWDLFLPASVKERLRELQFGPYTTGAAARSSDANAFGPSSPPRVIRKPRSMTVGTGNRTSVAAATAAVKQRRETVFGPPPSMLRAESPVRVRPERRLSHVGGQLRRWMDRERAKLAREATRQAFWMVEKRTAFAHWWAQPRSFDWSAEPVHARIRVVRSRLPSAETLRRLTARLGLPIRRMPAVGVDASDEALQSRRSARPMRLAWRAAAAGAVLLVAGGLTYLAHDGAGGRETTDIAGTPTAAATAAADSHLDPAAEDAGPAPITLPGERTDFIGPMPLPRDEAVAVGAASGARAEAEQERQVSSTQPAAATPSSSGSDGATPPAPTRAQVEAVQRMLAGLGFDPGPIDGLMGPRTRTAVRAFQQSRGSAATGTVDAGLIRDLEARAD